MGNIDIPSFIRNEGLAIFLICLVAWFVIFQWWPDYKKRRDERDKFERDRAEKHDAEDAQRQDRYLQSLDRGNVLMEQNNQVIKAMEVAVHSLAEMIGEHTNRVDDYRAEVNQHHSEVMRELRGHE